MTRPRLRSCWRLAALGLAAPLAALAACSADPIAVAWHPTSATADPTTELAVAHADAASAALAGELMAALTTALEEEGPAAAIRVCSELAPALAQRIGREQDVAIGRTSFRLRNQRNTAPDWARDAVQARGSEPLVFAHDDGRVARLRPIRLAAACLQCHGSAEQLAPGVDDALATLYPDDAATGFAEDEVRGYFWVEVPAGE
jgi:hypothetical protein